MEYHFSPLSSNVQCECSFRAVIYEAGCTRHGLWVMRTCLWVKHQHLAS